VSARELYQGKDVLAKGRGRCSVCCRDVIRVLVADPASRSKRAWHAAEIGNFGYVPHVCGPQKPLPPAPLKRAA
jgi:hypothetical protein